MNANQNAAVKEVKETRDKLSSIAANSSKKKRKSRKIKSALKHSRTGITETDWETQSTVTVIDRGM